MSRTEVHIVPKLERKLRFKEYAIDKFLLAPTRSSIKKALKKGWIEIDGETADTASFVSGGERVLLCVPERPESHKKLQLDLEVIYEDEYLAVVNKAPGLTVSGNKFVTLANALPQNLQKSTVEDAVSPYPVHRLDYPTTGALLIGKTKSVITQLMRDFEEKRIQKTYLAIAIGKLPDEGEIKSDVDGKKAHSTYRVLVREDSPKFEQLNLVELTPCTGRRHQLRVHLHSLGCPILGDQQYYLEGKKLKGKGLYLHAWKLLFKHPIHSEELTLYAPLPKKYFKIFPKGFLPE